MYSSADQSTSGPQHLPTHPSTSSTSSSSSSSSGKRVQFLVPTPLPAPSSADDLSESLLAGSFTDSDLSSSLPGAHKVELMSHERLRDSKPAAYSSLATQDDSDDDGPPPLESYHAASSSTASSSSACDNHAHGSGTNHGHSHGGRLSRNSSHSSGSEPGTPKRSPEANCGGMKKKVETAHKANKAARRQLGWAALCCCIFMICEVIGGFLANSLSIMTDAAHLLSDLAGFLISIFALYVATKPATSRLSFGFHRAEILGALISVLLIWLLTGILVYEACWRIANPEDVNGKLMFIIAAAGLVANGAMGLILLQSGHGHSHGLSAGGDDHGHSHGPAKKKKNASSSSSSSASASLNDHGHSHGSDGHDGDDHHGHSHGSSAVVNSQSSCDGEHADHADHDEPHEENMNVRAAFIHVLGDAIQSMGVMIAGGLIWWKPEWRIADPLCTFFFSILVLFTTTRLIKQSVGVLMEGVPDGIDPDEVEASLLEVPGVIAVHDLHIWSLSVGKPSLSVHLYCRDDAAHVLAAANKMCGDKYNIHHSTIQVERQHDDVACNDAFLPGNASLDRIASENFGALGLHATSVEEV